MKGYFGHIEDIDLSIYRGVYTCLLFKISEHETRLY